MLSDSKGLRAMDQPSILLIGKNGQVGWELQRTLAPLARLVAVDYPEIDLKDGGSIRKWITETRPAVIVNAAAHTAVDQAESEPDLAQAVNGLAPGIMAEEARRRGALLVHYSTDYVFDGTKDSPYVEEDTPNPLSAYGHSKLAGEQAIRQVGGAHFIFRLCWVYGARGKNFLLTIKRLASERERLRVVADQVGAPTWSRLIAEATALALKQALAAPHPAALSGLYHLCAAGQTSWHSFASSIVSLMPADGRKCAEVEPITTAQYPTPARRPARSVLCCDKLQRVFGLRLPPWDESLRQVFEESAWCGAHGVPRPAGDPQP
jgi:dTDP-4-dehydrorhamnose reductase